MFLKVFIENSTFSSNLVIWNNKGQYLSTCLYFEKVNIFLFSSSFSNNIFVSSTQNTLLYTSGTCLTAINSKYFNKKTTNINSFFSLTVNSSKFIGNQASSITHGIFFSGFSFFLSFSSFSNNNPYGIYASISKTSGFGGCLSLVGARILVENVQFSNNSKNQGGAVSIRFPFNTNYKAKILFYKCLFFNNTGYIGGAFYLSTNYKITFILKECSQISNYALNSKIHNLSFFTVFCIIFFFK